MFGFLCSVFHHAEAFTKVNRKLSRKWRTMLNQSDANEKNKRMRAVTVMWNVKLFIELVKKACDDIGHQHFVHLWSQDRQRV